MSLDKSILAGKEKRKRYYKSKAVCRACRNHGACNRCRDGRLHNAAKRLESTKDQTPC